MKMAVIVYSGAVDDVVMAALKKVKVEGFTEWQGVLGEGRETGPKLGTHCWPGKNNVLALVVEDEVLPALREIIVEIKRLHPKAGLKTFILPVEETI